MKPSVTTDAVAFTIPMPPSTNKLFRNNFGKGRGRIKTKAYHSFTAEAICAIRQQNVQPIKGNIIMVWAFERDSKLADVSNRIKAAEDAIVDAGIIDDDRFATAHFLCWAPKANSICHVQIFSSQHMALEFYPSDDGSTGAIIVNKPTTQGENNDDDFTV